MNDESAIRLRAKEWAAEALHFSEPLASMIQGYLDEIPLSEVGLPYCPACESVLCGACGDCHGLDLEPNRPDCPADNDTMGETCVAWWQAHKAAFSVQHEDE